MVIIRFSENDTQTLGKFTILDEWNCEVMQGYTLELADRNNQRRISRIYSGEYQVVKRNSPKFKDHFHVLEVPGRDWILIHKGNYHDDTNGCILVGSNLVDIDGDGLKDVTNSGNTMDKLNHILPDEFDLEIINHFG